MFYVWLIFITIVLGFIVIIKFSRKQQPKFLVYSLIILVGIVFSYPSLSKTADSTKVQNVSAETEKEELTVDQMTSEEYISSEVEPLIKSVSTNVDLNWSFYYEEPLARVSSDKDLERFESDLNLLSELYKGILNDLDNSIIPPQIDVSDRIDIEEIKSGLYKAITKRIEVLNVYTNFDDLADIVNYDAGAIIEESNNYLYSSTSAYAKLLYRYNP